MKPKVVEVGKDPLRVHVVKNGRAVSVASGLAALAKAYPHIYPARWAGIFSGGQRWSHASVFELQPGPDMRIVVSAFAPGQGTATFEHAPQREEYASDKEHTIACCRYVVEWQQKYRHVLNSDPCPKCKGNAPKDGGECCRWSNRACGDSNCPGHGHLSSQTSIMKALYSAGVR